MPKPLDKDRALAMCSQLAERLDDLYDWDAPHLSELINKHKDEIGWKTKEYFMTLRFILTGRKDSPPLDESMRVLGRDIVRFRLRNYMTYLARS